MSTIPGLASRPAARRSDRSCGHVVRVRLTAWPARVCCRNGAASPTSCRTRGDAYRRVDSDQSEREVRLIAEPRPTNRLLTPSLASTRLPESWSCSAQPAVWTRPGLMTWGFFIYVIQFNPGQAFQFWAWVQLWPGRFWRRTHSSCDAGRGLCRAFALRAEGAGRLGRGRWRIIEPALPLSRLCSSARRSPAWRPSLGIGRDLARAMVFIGFAVSVAALAILIGVWRDLSPRDYQRIRLVIWGRLIGLPAYLLAQLSQQTSLFGDLLAKARRRKRLPARSSSSTGSCACSWSRPCGGSPWSTSGSRFAG